MNYKAIALLFASCITIEAMEQDVKSLVKKYPHPINWQEFEKEDLRQYTKDEIEPFLLPSIICRQELVYNKILDEGISTQVCDEHGNTALVTALLHGNKKAVQTLLNKKARVDYPKPTHQIFRKADHDTQEKQRLITTWDAALLNGDVDLIKPIYERIPEKDTREVRQCLFEKPLITGDNTMVHALRTGNEKLFNFLMACDRYMLNTVFHSDDWYAHNTALFVRFPSLAPLTLLFTEANSCYGNLHSDTLLYGAVQAGNLPALQFLLSKKKSKPTLRMVADAAINEHKDIAQELLKHAPEPEHETALGCCIAQTSLLKPVALLIKLGADINATTKYGETPLMEACKDLSKVPIVEYLLQQKARVKPIDERKRTALHYACEMANEQVIPLLLKAGADVHATDSSGVTPLHLAVRCSKKTLESLLQAGADPNAVTHYGSTPLMEATTVEAVKTLMEAGADIHECKDAILLKSTKHANAELAIMMLNLQARIDITDKKGNTPLINWVKSHSQYSTNNKAKTVEQVTKVLLKHGSDPNAQDNENGLAPLHYAVSKYHNESMVTQLLDAGADPNLQTKSGETPLDKALNSGYREMIPLLLARGANPQMPDPKGQTAVMKVAHKIAQSKEYYWLEVLQMFIKASA